MTSSKPVAIIVAALLPEFGIGYNNGLPWRLSNELKYFKRVTVGDETHSNAVIMGRKTWESIPAKFRPLPDRLNVVITRNRDAKPEGSELIFHSVKDALAKLQTLDSVKKVFIIGGQQIYAETLPLVDHLLITELETENKVDIDTYFDKDYVHKHFAKQTPEALQQFINFNTQTSHNEKGFTYNFTLYAKK